MRNLSSAKTAAVILLAVAFVLTGTLAFAQSKRLIPGPSELIFGWNDENLDGWGGNPGPVLNKDKQFITEGTGSAMVDFTDQPTWATNAFTLDLPEPVDWSKYAYVTVDVFTPQESIGEGSGWNELWLDAGGYIGVRGLKIGGWQTLAWALDPNKTTAITRVVIGGNTGAPFAGPLYFDNFRGYPGKAQGMGPLDKLIVGYNDQASIDRLVPTTHGGITVGVKLNKNKDYISEGEGSLEIDVTDIGGWNPNVLQPESVEIANIDPPVDLSKANCVKYDVYIPDGNQPTDWYGVGIRLRGSAGQTLEYYGSALTGWNTLIVPIPDELREALKDVHQVWFLFGSGQQWRGPVYIDAVRYMIEEEVPPAPAVVPGDINGDGKVGIPDATLALQMAVGKLQPTPAQLAAGDINKNGKIDIPDVTVILRAAVGLQKLS